MPRPTAHADAPHAAPQRTDPLRILVTGGEGLVGSAVVRNLLRNGHDVTTLTLPGVRANDGVRVVRGDARDPEAVAEAARDADAVAHLAAIADPEHEPAEALFAVNTQATFTVLWGAARRGVRRFVVASSGHAVGIPLNPHRRTPDRYPIGPDSVADRADPYSLAKHVDEQTLATVCRRFAGSGVAFRLPLIVSPANAADLWAWAGARLDRGAREGWGWLAVDDAAEAFRRALAADYDGAHVLQIAADEVFADDDVESLLERYAPDVPRDRAARGRAAPIDTEAAESLLGFRPERTLADLWSTAP